MSPIKNQKQLKRNNVKKIILAIKQAKTTSKTQLSKGLGLSFATVSNICNELMDKGMVWIEESETSTGGRKPADIGLNKNSRYILTLNLSNNLYFEVALLNLHFETISKTRKTFSKLHQFESLIEEIKNLYTDILKKTGINESVILGLGVAIPGTVSLKTGLVVESSNPLLTYNDLHTKLETSLKLPTFISNDANISAIMAATFFDKNFQNLLYIYFSKGIGLGIILDGSIYTGAEGYAGELGHWKVTDSDIPCECGQTGCFRMVTLERILRGYYSFEGSNDEFSEKEESLLDDFVKKYKKGNKEVHNILSSHGRVIGDVIGTLTDIFNPEVVVLGGTLSPLLQVMIGDIRAAAGERSFNSARAGLQIETDQDSEETVLKGCAEGVFQQWLDGKMVRE